MLKLMAYRSAESEEGEETMAKILAVRDFLGNRVEDSEKEISE